MELAIRKATLEDMELLVEWRMEVLREVFSIPQNQPADHLRMENRRYYQRALQTNQHIACFACLDGTIAGCGGVCFYREMPSPDNPTGECAYLMNVYTRPRFRKRGIGKTLVQWLIGEARKRGVFKIYLESSEAGKDLYTRIGFVPMQGMMKFPIIKKS